MTETAMDIDESLYSRQLYVMGHAAMKKMATSDVLIVGLNGLGVEAAKNVILAGVKSVTFYDPTPVTYVDLSAQFFLSEADLGKSRAEVSVPKLAELNSYVPVSILEGGLDEDNIRRFACVVLIEYPLSQAISIGDFCHTNGIKFITADTFGVMGSIFCDFGENFSISDASGEPPATAMVAGISNETEALVTCEESTRHNLSTGDTVILSSMNGMSELNDREFTVNVKSAFTFTIDCDTSSLGIYQGGGYMNQVLKPFSMSFKPLSACIVDPGMITSDVTKMDRAPALHLLYRSIHRFKDAHDGNMPIAGSMSDAEEVYSIASSMNTNDTNNKMIVTRWNGNSKQDEDGMSDSKNLLTRLTMCCAGHLSPVCALVGGILGQEILKACSGKFTPIQQWYYYDAYEALPDEPLSAEEVSPQNCRYDGQIMVFGKQMQQRLLQSTTFLVGAGAIGCEMLKNWAMMGVSCGKGGMTHVTDMDIIEKSNLSRQFLFRNKDIQKPKSTTAVRAVCDMNPAFQSCAYESKVAPDTEDQFNDDFWESLNFVCTALDNVEARLYVDQQCVFYQKPLMESGTLGTKGHTQIVVPFKTENYGATRDPPEASIPVCTLKNFPNQIEHTLQWARDWFEGEFKQTPSDCNLYLKSNDFQSTLAQQQNMKLDILTRVKAGLLDDRPMEFRDCVVWARNIFEDLFANKVKQLIHSFPLDSVTSSGVPFWSGTKRPPSPLQFDPRDPLHMEFIQAVANIRANCYSLPPCWEEEYYLAVLPTIKVPIFTPSSTAKIATTEEEAKAEREAQMLSSSDVDGQCNSIMSSLENAIGSAGTVTSITELQEIEFEKDDDNHMRVITACSNLRATNYQIPVADLHKSRGIAGKIIPAIATTTALVVGAICMELYKVMLDKPIEKLACMTANIAFNQYVFSEPQPPKVTKSELKGEENNFTPWDRIDINDPNITLNGLMELLENEYKLVLTMLSNGVSILYSDFMQRKKVAERKDMKVSEIVEQVTKKPLNKNKKYLVLELIVTDEDDEEIEIPYVRFRL